MTTANEPGVLKRTKNFYDTHIAGGLKNAYNHVIKPMWDWSGWGGRISGTVGLFEGLEKGGEWLMNKMDQNKTGFKALPSFGAKFGYGAGWVADKIGTLIAGIPRIIKELNAKYKTQFIMLDTILKRKTFIKYGKFDKECVSFDYGKVPNGPKFIIYSDDVIPSNYLLSYIDFTNPTGNTTDQKDALIQIPEKIDKLKLIFQNCEISDVNITSDEKTGASILEHKIKYKDEEKKEVEEIKRIIFPFRCIVKDKTKIKELTRYSDDYILNINFSSWKYNFGKKNHFYLGVD